MSAPFQDTIRMAKVIFPSMPTSIINGLVHHKWNNTKAVEHLSTSSRLTILHSQADAIVPYTQGQELSNIARSNGIRTKMVTFTWGGHNEIFNQHLSELQNAMNDDDASSWNDPNLLQVVHSIEKRDRQKHKSKKKGGRRAQHTALLPALRR